MRVISVLRFGSCIAIVKIYISELDGKGMGGKGDGRIALENLFIGSRIENHIENPVGSGQAALELGIDGK